MKSYEQHIREKCPAVLAWHKLVWEESLNESVEASPTEDDVLVEEIVEPVIKEWRTINGKRKINDNFAKNMSVGY
tara:strand:- start:35007 stop:35231 length:225 start_codon:yes stop_codon:yes gene_type:complete